MKKIYILLCLTALTACMKDLDQRPVTATESDATEVYSTPEGFRSVLAKLYASFTIIGQEKGGGNADIASNNGQDFLRCYFNLQEAPTDEVACTWLSGDKIEALTFMTWDASDPWVADVYYRLYYSIALCNEFLRHTDSSVLPAADAATMRDEARFLRALAYWAVLDLFGQGPFVDETMPVGAFTPEAYDSVKLFSFIEKELKDLALPSRTGVEYGRASQGAAWTLLARLYLNAETYGAGDHYTDCITYCKKVRGEGYSLEADWSKLFNADNNLRTNEIIFPFVVDATNTVTWGSTTHVICGQVGNENNQNPANYGLEKGWGMFRVRGELPALFGNVATTKDSRCKFYTADSQQWFTGNIDNQGEGYFSEKWSNLKDDGTAASASAESGVSTDWPMFRLAEVYLMEAEAVLRGGQGATRAEALGLFNDLRLRAYGDATGNVADGDFDLDLILDERARELYHEAVRRTDLRRFGKFTTNAYIWQWKGGALAGRAVDDKYNIYPIPAAELSANTNLKNAKY
ncbi:MAG: RagB/SusD family nutrient uptake outer membrane protein [Bacteroidales bacterium]|nr:RagB/SusD family nutrient uptake outer membrane protein [Bacteroidales bacterium]